MGVCGTAVPIILYIHRGERRLGQALPVFLNAFPPYFLCITCVILYGYKAPR